MKYRHLITAGCSFTADGIGGVPPTKSNLRGGNSYVGDNASNPKTWAGFLAKDLQVDSMVNLSFCGGGIMPTAITICDVLTRFLYRSPHTLVVFNISDPARYHVQCGLDHPNPHAIPWDNTVLDYGWLIGHHAVIKDMGFEQVEKQNATLLRMFMNYLINQGITFRFMTMMDYTQHDTLGAVIKDFDANYVRAQPGIGMYEYSHVINSLDPDGIHPGVEAHRSFADMIMDSLEDNT